MLPKKLFTPKCLHLDRDIVFREDIANFFRHVVKHLKDNDMTLPDYVTYKRLYREKKISMLHFSKSKEENQKEYYEVLFGEIQSFMIEDRLKDNEKEYSMLFKILSIFTLYSVYYTQTTDYFYQINTIPEILIEINKVISALTPLTMYSSTRNQIVMMINKLYNDEAFSIGTVIGLKTIILNKYGLPLELKENIYNDYMDINQSASKLNAFGGKGSIDALNGKRTEYAASKKFLVDAIKGLCNDFPQGAFDMESYCDFINCNNNLDEGNKVQPEHLVNNNVNNFDILFNQVDSKIYNIKKEI
jgi:hypothetical protein